MKKKLLEKDGFYLALFACVCLVAVGGVWFTNNNVNELTSDKGLTDDDKEIHLIEDEKKENPIPTATDSDQNLEKAKEEEASASNSKLNYVGTEVIREYSEKDPSYSETLEVWEIHKGLDIKATEGQDIKSILTGTVVDVFEDDEYGVSVKIKSDNNTEIVYSNLDKEIKVEKNQEIKEGDVIGKAGNTSAVESKEGPHVHLEAFKDGKITDPMEFLK